MSIHAADGRVVQQTRSQTDRLDLDVRALPAGAYTIITSTTNTRSATRFIKH
ncbi:MAG: T9SS type A sorting domain-containing protein [Flavobacteriales bacterium]|nr:T9SS type A sorting domain-containing protein [Flavobacteriales bacterium]